MQMEYTPSEQTDESNKVASISGSATERRGAEQFVPEPRVEAVLIDHGLPVNFRVVNLADIDLAVLDNGEPERQMRTVVIDPATAARYADDLSWGAKFPAGVLSDGPGSRFAIIDFHHRLHAARVAGFSAVSAYVVPLMDDFSAIELGTLLNRNHGLPLNEAERVRQALWGLDLGRFQTMRQAARTLGVKESAVARARRIREAKAMAAKTGVPLAAFEKLPTSAQDRLGCVASPDVFRAATESVIRKGLGTQQVSELVTKIGEAAGDTAKLDVVRAFATEIQPRKTQVVNLADPWLRIHAACRNLLAVDLGPEFDDALRQRTATDLSKLFGEVTEVIERLGVIADKLDTAEGVDAQSADICEQHADAS